MRISVMGSFSVGKTTLQERLARALGLTAILEGSRVIADAWGYTPATIPGKLLWEFQESILHRQLAQEELYHNRGFVTDTCTIDNCAWMYHLAATKLVVPDEFKERYVALAASRAAQYDVLFLVPPVIDLEDDGVRHTDVQLREEIHTRVLAMICRFDTVYGTNLMDRMYTIQADTPDERLLEALSVIEQRVTVYG